MVTLNDIQEKLKTIDEVSLLELLDIHSDEIVDKFVDKIEDMKDFLLEELADEPE